MQLSFPRRSFAPLIVLLIATSSLALADSVLSSSGLTNCVNNADIKVNNADISFDATSGIVVFNVSGTSNKVQNVTAALAVTAYGNQIYQKTFNPCDNGISQLCPGTHCGIPSGW